MAVYRCFVEKKTPFAVEAAGVLSDLRTALRTEEITGVRVLNRYDIENIEGGPTIRWRRKPSCPSRR